MNKENMTIKINFKSKLFLLLIVWIFNCMFYLDIFILELIPKDMFFGSVLLAPIMFFVPQYLVAKFTAGSIDIVSSANNSKKNIRNLVIFVAGLITYLLLYYLMFEVEKQMLKILLIVVISGVELALVATLVIIAFVKKLEAEPSNLVGEVESLAYKNYKFMTIKVILFTIFIMLVTVRGAKLAFIGIFEVPQNIFGIMVNLLIMKILLLLGSYFYARYIGFYNYLIYDSY